MSTQDEYNELEQGILNTVMPRQHWTGSYAHLSQEFQILVQCAAHGVLSLHTEHTISHTFPRYFDWRGDHEYDHEMAGPATARRGRDLPDLTWSAFKFLQNLHPDARFEPFSSYLPFGWLHEESGTFVTAGNNDFNRLLPFICENGIVRLGVIDYQPAVTPSDAERAKYELHESAQEQVQDDGDYAGSLWMNWMVLERRALQVIQRLVPRF